MSVTSIQKDGHCQRCGKVAMTRPSGREGTHCAVCTVILIAEKFRLTVHVDSEKKGDEFHTFHT
jgi:hypothetical protein